MAIQEHWCDCKFTGAQLNGKKVEFRFAMEGMGHEGKDGTFMVAGNPEGKLSVQIDTPISRLHPQEARHLVFSLPCSLVERIESHPEAKEKPDGPQFRLWEPLGNTPPSA